MYGVTVLRFRRAYSPVIAALILSASVLVVGGFVWSYSQGTTTMIAEDYVSGVNDLVDEISERFVIEHVAHNSTHVRVWLYNYGEIEVMVDVYADIDGGASGYETAVELDPKEFVEVDVELAAASGEEVAVKAVSRRGNNACYRYIA